MWIFWVLWLVQGGDETVRDEIQVDFAETVTMVNLPLKVSRRGTPYRKLKQNQLQLVENGVAVSVDNLREIETPVTLHFLFDLSTSNARSLVIAKKSVRELLRRMHSNDLGKISFFSSRYQPLTSYTRDRQTLENGLARLTPVGSTALYDAMSRALDELMETNGSRVLVVFSDGHDLISQTTEDELMGKVKNYRVPIIFVAYRSPGLNEQPLLEAQVRFLERLADESGGATLDGLSGYFRSLNNLIDNQRRRYLVSFQAPGPGDLEQWRSLMVRIDNCPECQLEYRRAYRLGNLDN